MKFHCFPFQTSKQYLQFSTAILFYKTLLVTLLVMILNITRSLRSEMLPFKKRYIVSTFQENTMSINTYFNTRTWFSFTWQNVFAWKNVFFPSSQGVKIWDLYTYFFKINDPLLQSPQEQVPFLTDIGCSTITNVC